MANKNTNLHRAKRCKDDEFYTTYETIENELAHSAEQFKNKTVLCNCDNPFTSNFTKFFLQNFNVLGLKRLICTSFSPYASVQPSLFESFNDNNSKGYILDISKINKSDFTSETISDFLLSTHYVKELNGNGDFRSLECINYLKECDIVVTNPPFSLFKEMVSEIMKYNKKFLIIGNQNALTYKEIFPLIQNNLVWTGYQFGEMKFRVPQDSEPRSTRYWVDETGQKWRSLGNAIHVRNITEIPFDYTGIMGVPITIINRYNSEQFEIIGEANHGSDSQYDIFKPILNGKEVFKRILIRNKAIAI